MTSRSLLEQTWSLELTLMLKIAEPLNLFHFSCLNDGLNRVTSANNGSGSLKCWFSSVPWYDECIKFLYSWVSDNKAFYKEHHIYQCSFHFPESFVYKHTIDFMKPKVKWEPWLRCSRVFFFLYIFLLCFFYIIFNTKFHWNLSIWDQELCLESKF